MNRKINLEEIEKNIDFEGVIKKLDNLTATGGLKRRKNISDLLDRVEPALLRARENKVSYKALAEFLMANGIPVSEPTLRAYLSKDKKSKKPRTKPSPKLSTGAGAMPAEKPGTTASNPTRETPCKKKPPRLARSNI